MVFVQEADIIINEMTADAIGVVNAQRMLSQALRKAIPLAGLFQIYLKSVESIGLIVAQHDYDENLAPPVGCGAPAHL